MFNEELAKEYGADGLTACPMLKEGQVFYADYAKPAGLCDVAWKAIYQYVFALAHGSENELFYYANSVYRSKDNGIDIKTDNFAMKEGWSLDSAQTTGYSVNMYSGLKYQNFDGNKYLDGAPFMASAIFAQNDDDLKGWSGTTADLSLIHICTDQDMVQRMLAAKSSKAGTRAVIVSGLLDFPIAVSYTHLPLLDMRRAPVDCRGSRHALRH